MYDIHSKLVREEKKEITSRAYEPVKVFEKIAGPCFVSLEIDGPFKARNFYAIPAGNNVYSGKDEWWGVETDKYADLRFVSELPEALVRMDIRKTGDSYEITLENVSEVIAYQNILKALDNSGNLLPGAFWSDNFLSLAPGEKCTVRCTPGPGEPVFAFNSWNAKLAE